MASLTPGDHPLRRVVLRTIISMTVLIVLSVLVFAGIFAWQVYRDHAPLLRAVVPSPDGHVQALLQSDDALVHEYYGVRLKPAGGRAVEVARFQSLQRYGGEDGADLVWVNNNMLEIRYLSARQPYLEKGQLVLDGVPRTIRLVNNWIANGPQPGRIAEPPYRSPCPYLSILCR